MYSTLFIDEKYRNDISRFQEAILWAMDRAEKYIYIAVNEYLPADVYKNNAYWPIIDDKIREGSPYFHL